MGVDKVGGTWGGAARTRCWGTPRSPASPAPAAPESASSPVATKGSRSPANPPSCGSRPGPAEERRCDSPPLPLPASVSPRAKRRRLPSSRLPLDSTAAAAPPSPVTLADRSPMRPWPLRGMGLGSPGEGTSRSWEAQVQRLPRLALVQSLASARVASDPSSPPRLPAKHSPKVICYLFEGWGLSDST